MIEPGDLVQLNLLTKWGKPEPTWKSDGDWWIWIGFRDQEETNFFNPQKGLAAALVGQRQGDLLEFTANGNPLKRPEIVESLFAIPIGDPKQYSWRKGQNNRSAAVYTSVHRTPSVVEVLRVCKGKAMYRTNRLFDDGPVQVCTGLSCRTSLEPREAWIDEAKIEASCSDGRIATFQFGGNALYEKIRDDAVANTKESAIGCFVAGTLVHTKEGLVPIEQIKTGDWVLSKPESGEGEIAYKRVVNTFEFYDKEVWYVSYSLKENPRQGEDDTDSLLVVTGNHPFWVVAEEDWGLGNTDDIVYHNTWMRADQLEAGMSLQLCDGRTGVVTASKRLMRMAMPYMGWMPGNWHEHAYEAGNVVDMKGKSPKYSRGPIQIGNDQFLFPIEVEDFVITTMLGTQRVHIDDRYCNEGVDWSKYDDGVWLKRKVYNFEVEEDHTYFVGDFGVWVHNTNCGSEKLNAGDTPEVRDQKLNHLNPAPGKKIYNSVPE